MKKIIIITNSFFDFELRQIRVGGLETYIKDLALLIIASGYECVVYQVSSKNESDVRYLGVLVKTICKKTVFKSVFQSSFDYLYKNEICKETDKIIIATDQLNIKSLARNVITIQHGIAFDIPGDMLPGFWRKYKVLHFANKVLRCAKNVSRFYYTRNLVCVDYNYYNWLRTIATIYSSNKLCVIPNYASSVISKKELDIKLLTKKANKRIIFARRFVDYRGTLLFVKVVNRLLKTYSNIDITFAGNGPLQDYIENEYKHEKRVVITSFQSSESVSFHKRFDIAVVPTLFSEGTSLSLCEAMAAGCFPIATHVGGMTNMIIDNFNGRLVYPSEDHVFNALVDTLELAEDNYNAIVANSYNTIINSFVKEKWGLKWIDFIDSL